MTVPSGRPGITPGPVEAAVSIDGTNGAIPALPGLDQPSAEALLKQLFVQFNPKINDPLNAIFGGLREGIPFALAVIESIVQRLLGGSPLFLNIDQALAQLTTWWEDILDILGNPGGIGSGSIDIDQIWTDLFDNIINPLGLAGSIAEVADAIFEAIMRVVRNPSGDPVTDILDALRNIPFLNVLGVGGPASIGDALQATWDAIVGGAVGAPGTGAGLADNFNIMNLISSWASLGRNSWDVLGIRSNKPFWNGMLPTGVANIPLPLHQSTAPTFPVTQSTATMSFHHIDEGSSKSVVSWTGSGITSITAVFVNIYKMATNGVMDLVHESANILGDVSAALGTNIYTLPTPLAVLPGETYGIEVAVRGAGTHNILGVQSWQTFDHPTVFPRRMAAVRNSGTTAPPATIAAASVTYSANIPVIEFAVSGGEFDNHQPTVFGPYTTPGAYSLPAASWANFIEVIEVPGGGGGRGGQIASDGDGGAAGAWATTTWVKGTDYTTAPTITINVGAGGTAGSGNGGNGGNSVVSIPGHTLTATGGVGASSGGGFADHSGRSPGNQNYGVPSQVYVGGGVASNYSSDGSAPGGGGAGGNGVILSAGGRGAPGAVWIRFRQT